ncbi:MAG: alpha/beta hydrolase [Phycisphaerales bacterium JB039]
MSDSGRTWSIAGSGGEAILGNTHAPGSSARGVAIIVHGFLGYKDYGMFPAIATAFAEAGWIAHRINLSHSGMTDDIQTFGRPDLFERDTWNRQRADVQAVIAAIEAGRIPGAGLPLALFGHSRGGVTVLRAAAQRFDEGLSPLPAGVITVAAPDTCCSLDGAAKEAMRQRGYHEVVSNRTGQTLRLGRDWLAEQEADPEGHDVPGAAAKVVCPLLVAHGAEDPTVPPFAARAIAGAAPDGRLLLIDGGDHVMNTPNPFDPAAEPSPQLRTLLGACREFLTGAA